MPEIKTDHYITVAKLRELLAEESDDALVVMSKDAEGNGFSLFSGIGNGRYVAESSWAGDLADDEDDPEDGAACIVLWPVH